MSAPERPFIGTYVSPSERNHWELLVKEGKTGMAGIEDLRRRMRIVNNVPPEPLPEARVVKRHFWSNWW